MNNDVPKPALPIALVSGVSSGIGLNVALRLKKAGYKVYGLSRRATQSVAVAEGIECRDVDVRQVKDLRAIIASIEATEGRIDLLVNAAGVLSIEKSETVSEETFAAQVDTSFRGTFFLSQAVIPVMVKQNRGLIINIGSVVGELPSPKMAVYAAAKAAVISLSKSLAAEYVAMGIRVICVSPGVVQTGLVDKMLLAMMAKKTPLQRPFRAEEVAQFIVEIAVNHPEGLTGANLTYAGGMNV